MRFRTRAIALSTTLYVVFAVLLFGLTLATLAAFQYNLARQSVTRTQALIAAQAGVARAVATLTTQPDFGTNPQGLAETLQDGTSYQVTFDPMAGIPWSVNNIRQSSGAPGYQKRPVPPHCALLFSSGTTRGGAPDHTRTLECMVQFPPYPYAISATGQIRSLNALRVDGLATLGAPLAGVDNPEGDIYSGSDAADAIACGPGTTLTGEARTPGGATFGPGSTVAGGIQTGVDREAVPSVDIRSYDNQGVEGVSILKPGSYARINGPAYVNGDVKLYTPATKKTPAGPAILQNAYLYVDGGGHLDAPYGLQGMGSIFVTGATDLEGTSLDASTGIAIFSQGDLTLHGDSTIQGALYSHGAIRVPGDLTVVGSIIAESDTPGGIPGSIEFDGLAKVTYFPEYTQFANVWTDNNMKGFTVNTRDKSPIIKTLFWREMP